MVCATPHSLADAVLAGTLFVLALVTRFAFLKYPREVVFDEYHFGKFVNGYVLGEYFFDIHPPLGKLLLLLGAWAGGYDGSQGWRSIGEPIGGAVNLFALRAVPAAQGALLPPLLYAAGRAAGLSRPAAVLAPAGVLFDVCCLVEQRARQTTHSVVERYGCVLRFGPACLTQASLRLEGDGFRGGRPLNRLHDRRLLADGHAWHQALRIRLGG